MTGRGSGYIRRYDGTYKAWLSEHYRVRGHWVEDSPRFHSRWWAPDDPLRECNVPAPVHFIRAEGRLEQFFHEDSTADGTEAMSKDTFRDGSFPFMQLPAELRMRVYSYLIQTGCIVYGQSSNRFYTTKHHAVITIVKPKFSPIWHDNVSALFCVNRQIRDECYEMLYGENTFVLFKTTNMTRRSIRPTCIRTSQSEEIEMWTRIIPGLVATQWWPLTANTIPFLKTLKLLIYPTYYRRSAPHGKLVNELQTMAETLKEHGHKLQSLELTVSKESLSHVTRTSGIYIRHNVLEKAILVKANNNGTLSTTLEATRYDDGSVPMNGEQYLLESFAILHGIRDVKVSGLVQPYFAQQLSGVMMNSQPPVLKRSPLEGVTVTQVRKKRYSVRKVRRQVSALKPWDPRIIWEVEADAAASSGSQNKGE